MGCESMGLKRQRPACGNDDKRRETSFQGCGGAFMRTWWTAWAMWFYCGWRRQDTTSLAWPDR